MFRRISQIVFATAAAVFLVSCSGAAPAVKKDALQASQSLNAERPKEEAFRTELKKEVSSLGLTIETTTVIAKELYKGGTSTTGLAAEVLRNGPVIVSATDNYIHLTMPVNLSLSYGFLKTPLIPLKLKFKARATVTPDWRQQTRRRRGRRHAWDIGPGRLVAMGDTPVGGLCPDPEVTGSKR